ncbi:VOC family protein [Paraliomyxa miuraensis]|uniref:VOC family protein n=1 Tax=Paraliomyxa miuraensis TaxID=376150 RepID=UPI0022549BBF|nr:VOC family protein [Paraliomyxa miuraensis]MCX4242399.1 VOC family protein [Paraliomyxa miuraensis]
MAPRDSPTGSGRCLGKFTRRWGIVPTTEVILVPFAGMEKITGIGGFFFRSRDPGGLAKWYEQHFGISVVPTSYDGEAWAQEAGTTVWAPFPEDTKMFGRPEQQWMINFRVRELDAMVEQLRGAGIEVVVDPEQYPNGRFATLADPEGNPIQLWQPQVVG